MARLCIRVKANLHPTDSTLNAKRTQAGDVVCVVEDGHVFSAGELNCGHYRIIDVPGVSQADMISLIESVFDTDGATMLKRRKWEIPITILNNATWVGRTTATKAQIDAVVVLKA
jgi:hypothetical protein